MANCNSSTDTDQAQLIADMRQMSREEQIEVLAYVICLQRDQQLEGCQRQTTTTG